MDTNTKIKRKEPIENNCIHGGVYQTKVLMFFLHRGITHKYSFRLGTEIKEASAFNDVVFEYTENNKKIYRLLQIKHSLDGDKKIGKQAILNSGDGDFTLAKYFIYYRELKKENFFKDATIKDVIICTNKNFNLRTFESPKINVLEIKNEDNILDITSLHKQPTRYKFGYDIIPLLKREVQQYATRKKIKTADDIEDEIKDFLDHLIFAVNQPDEEELGRIVKEEIGKEFDFINTENVYNKFFVTMIDWLKGKKTDKFFTYEEGYKFFEEAKKGIPIWFGVRSPIESFIGRKEQLNDLHNNLQIKNKSVALQAVAISGLGGVGKTELVRKYISLFSQEYDNKVLWINANNYQSLLESFHRLASDKLKISTKNANNTEKEISSIVEDVYRFFSNGKSLFIFDNAEKYKNQCDYDSGIEKFLPSLPINYNRPYVLITSRNKSWPESMKVLDLDVLEEPEALNFLKKSVDTVDTTELKLLTELANKLQFLPLALQQAVAYIREQDKILKNVGLTFSINNYLKEFEEKSKMLLNFNFPEENENDYTKTIFITWNITLDLIGQKENGSCAIELFNLLSYFASEDIPISMFSKFIKDTLILGSSIELLKQFSMISSLDMKLNVHRIVQLVRRLQLKEQDKEAEVLVEALKLFECQSNLTHESIDHAISAWKYACRYNQLMIDFSEIPLKIIRGLIHFIRYEEARLFGLQAIKLLSVLCLTNDKINLLEIKFNFGLVLQFLGKYDVALEHYNNMLAIENIESDQMLYFKIQNEIAKAYAKLGKNEKALSIHKDVHDKLTVSVGDAHLESLLTRECIANRLCDLGEYEEALAMLRGSLTIQKTTNYFLKADPRLIFRTKNGIAIILSQLEKHEEALQLFKEVLESSKTINSANHPNQLNIMNNIACIYLKQAKYAEALEIFKEVLHRRKSIYGDAHQDVFWSYYKIAEVLQNQGKHSEALNFSEEAYNGLKNILASNNSRTLDVQKQLVKIKASKALLDYEQGNYGQSFKGIQEVVEIKEKILRGRNALTIKDNTESLIISANYLINAVENNNYKDLMCLISDGGDVNSTDNANRSLLHYAANNNNLDIVTFLLEKGADITKITNKGNTSLHIATLKNHLEIVNTLLNYINRSKMNRIIDAKTSEKGTSALHVAAENGVFEIVKTLLKHGAIYNIPNANGETPFDLSTDQNINDLLKLIDALFEDVQKGNDVVIAKLEVLESDTLSVITKARNNQGHTLFEVAVANKHKCIATKLCTLIKN